MKLRTITLAAALTAVPLVSHAALIQGQLDIAGVVDVANSTFAEGGFVNFEPEVGTALIATGDFSPINTDFEPGDDTVFTLYDISFTENELIYSGGGFSFTATRYYDFDQEQSALGFMADGIITSTIAGLDPTPGFFEFSTEGMTRFASFSSTTTPIPLPASVLMLMGALGGLAFVGKRRSA